jgi:hypothetical protein
MHQIKTLLEVYDADMKLVEEAERDAERNLAWAREFSKSILQKLGVYFFGRGQGWDCWSHELLPNFYSTPRDAVVALVKFHQETEDASAQLQKERTAPSEESAERILGEVAGRA